MFAKVAAPFRTNLSELATVPSSIPRVAVPVPAPRLRVVGLSVVPVPLSKESVEPPDTTTEVMRPGFVRVPVRASVELPVALKPEAAVTLPATVNEPPSLAMTPLFPTRTEAPKDTAVLPALMMSSLPEPVFWME